MSIVYLIKLALVGMAGAFIRSILENKGSIILWRRWEADGKRGVDLGIIANLVVGIAVAVIVDQSLFTAFTWALTGPYLLQELVKVRMSGPPKLKQRESNDDDCEL